METNYWMQSSGRFSRRSVLRGAAVAGAGLSAAALIGCGADDDPGASTGTTPTTSTNGAGPSAPSTSGGGGTAAPAPAGVPAGAVVPRLEGVPQPGGTFTYGVAATYGQLDMHTALGSTPWHNISERAIELEEWTADLRPNAVESWEVVDDQGLELLLTVRPGLTMHDKEPVNGRDFDAEDLAFNLRRNGGLTADAEGIPLTSFQRRSMVANIQDAQAVDDRTVRVQLSAPNGAFFNGLAEIRMQLMPRESVDVGFDDPTKFASFGAYTNTHFETGVREDYVKHPNYYRQGEPYFDQYTRIALDDRASLLAAFIDRQTSLFASPLPHERESALAVNRDAQYFEWVNTNWDHFRWNMAEEALADARVRKALSWATNRPEIADGYYSSGWAHVAVTHPDYPEGWSQEKVLSLPGFNPDTLDPDRAEAASMLEAAGYPNGAGINIVIVPQISPAFEENALRFQDQMNTVFPEMQVQIQRPSDRTAFATRQAARDFSALSYTITVVPDVFLELHSQYHTDGSRNYGGFTEPIADDLLERGISALTMEERMEIADEFQQRFVDDWNANLVLLIQPERYLVQGNIAGFDTTAGPWGFTGYRIMNKASRWYYV